MALTLKTLRVACAAVLSVAAGLAAAQAPTGGNTRPDPLDPYAPVPAMKLPSGLSGYRAWGETPALSWRQANDDVTRIGGWRTYLRQAQEPDPPPPTTAPTAASAATPTAPGTPAPGPTAQPSATGHGGHHPH